MGLAWAEKEKKRIQVSALSPGSRCPPRNSGGFPAEPRDRTQCPSRPADGESREPAPKPRVTGAGPPACTPPRRDRAGGGCEAEGPGCARFQLGWPGDRFGSWERSAALSELPAGPGGGDLRQRLEAGGGGGEPGAGGGALSPCGSQ